LKRFSTDESAIAIMIAKSRMSFLDRLFGTFFRRITRNTALLLTASARLSFYIISFLTFISIILRFSHTILMSKGRKKKLFAKDDFFFFALSEL
jgi:hypothetical protein